LLGTFKCSRQRTISNNKISKRNGSNRKSNWVWIKKTRL
jgi:hypothetical protein